MKSSLQNIIFNIFSLFLCIYPGAGCKKLVEIAPPVNQLTNVVVFGDDKTATSATLGIYSSISIANATILYPSISSSCAADELIDYTNGYTAFYNNAIDPSNSVNSQIWQSYYRIIYQTNSLIEGLENSNTVSPSGRSQLTGEAKFFRAFCYFQLANFYGNVPLLTSTNVEVTASAPRSPIADVYKQVIADLTAAQSVLSDTYIGGERTRVNQSSASAMLARAYLYSGDWSNAEAASTAVINDPQYQLMSGLDSVFFKNSPESILQLWTSNGTTLPGKFIIPGPARPNVTFTDSFINNIETGDLRFLHWMQPYVYLGTTYYYPFKYKNSLPNSSAGAEYLMVLRLAEQFLIRAEARAEENNLEGAKQDLNIIRNRVGLANDTTMSQTELLTDIQKERRFELFTEWSHRWFDLKRTGTADSILDATKPNWKPTDVLYPVPSTEINANPALDQNSGY